MPLLDDSEIGLRTNALEVSAQVAELVIGLVALKRGNPNVVSVGPLQLLRTIIHHERLLQGDSEPSDLAKVLDVVALVSLQIGPLRATLGGPEEPQRTVSEDLSNDSVRIFSPRGCPYCHIKRLEAVGNELVQERAPIHDKGPNHEVWLMIEWLPSGMHQRFIKI